VVQAHRESDLLDLGPLEDIEQAIQVDIEGVRPDGHHVNFYGAQHPL
jgi:hypothetical protein